MDLVVNADPNHMYHGAPDLAIEVVSDSGGAEDLLGKIQNYLQVGTKVVWVFYPKLRVITVHDASGTRELRGEQMLDAPDVLPDFHAKASQFFV